MNRIFVCLFLCLAVASAANNPISIILDIFRNNAAPSQESIDDEIDNALARVHDLVKSDGLYRNFDPFDVPDISESQIKLTETKLYGFESFSRHGDAVVAYEDKLVTVIVQLSLENLTAVAQYALLGTHGTLTAEIEHIFFSISIHLDRSTFKINVENFEIKSIGTIDITLKGNSLSDSMMATVTKGIVKKKSKDVVSTLLKQVVEDLIQDHNNSV